MKCNTKIGWAVNILFSFGMVQVVSDPMDKLNLESGLIIKTHTNTHRYIYIYIYIYIYNGIWSNIATIRISKDLSDIFTYD